MMGAMFSIVWANSQKARTPRIMPKSSRSVPAYPFVVIGALLLERHEGSRERTGSTWTSSRYAARRSSPPSPSDRGTLRRRRRDRGGRGHPPRPRHVAPPPLLELRSERTVVDDQAALLQPLHRKEVEVDGPDHHQPIVHQHRL